MELKKFEAPTLAEALRVIKRELGPEAIILQTKNKKSGFGLMNSASVEVTAAVSPDALDRKKIAERNMNAQQIDRLYQKPAQKIVQAYDVLSGSRLTRELQARSAAEEAFEEENDYQAPAAPAPQPRSSIASRRYIDITDDESPAEMLSQRSSDRSSLRSGYVPAARPASRNLSSDSGVLPRVLAPLVEAGIDEKLIKNMADEVKAIMLKEHVLEERVLKLHLARILMSRIRVAKPLAERLRVPSTPRIISFVGPTGVGKTTTLAKIAAELSLNQKRSVILATTDTYKIAAIEQLQTYANILRIPLEVCPNAESLDQLSSQLGSEEVILVDTAGYGPKDIAKIRELQDTLSQVRTEVHLCMAATTRDMDLVETVKRYQDFHLNYLLFTKIDETSCYGNVFNVAAKTQMPLSYLTMGQRVPEDIEVATKERIADFLLNISGGGI
ncbi:MAG TPA: flagellar biosynthesis protein FlhF [Bdellovibrionota bacterium]|jgi:flagellar biosynthesis protein FlhF|nr:flagellar biosynthesis protein FlhF [Bdellovibrionota bacterium]